MSKLGAEGMTDTPRPALRWECNVGQQCCSRLNLTKHGQLRCQLPRGHTGEHFGPFGAVWPKKKKSEDAQ